MVYTRSKANNFRRAVVAGVGYAMKRRSSAYTATKSPAAKKAKLVAKRRSATRTYQKRRGDTPNYNVEYAATTVKYGRKPRDNYAQMSKLVRSNVSSTVFGMRCYSRFGGTSGYFPLINAQASTGSVYTAPLALFDLTSVVNDTRGVITAPKTVHTLSFGDETSTCPTIIWTNRVSNGDNLAIENAPASSAISDNYPCNSSLLRWIQAKLMFYAPTTLPTKISVQICRFKDARLVPDHTGVSNVRTDAFTIQFYQSLMKKYMLNPVEVSDPQNDRYLKIIHSNTFILNPKDSTESTNTNFKQLDIFEWVNRRCNYQWQDQDKTALNVQQDQKLDLAMNETSVHPLARTFLMIRAQSGYNWASNAFDVTKHPSFDIVLRTCHQQIN